MASTDISQLVAASRRWLAGGEASGAGGLAEGHSGREAQLRMLAEAAQLRQIVLRPVPPADLTPGEPLPALALPLLPEAARPLFRRLIKRSNERAPTELLISFMVARGVMAHPFDWLPPKDVTGFPPEYHPLAAWQAGAGDMGVPSPLSAETWEDYLPAARKMAFADLRRADPAGGRALLEAHSARVAAEERDDLVRLLAIGLHADDQSLLETLLTDRSGKVKSTAKHLLARLGVVTGGEAAEELAGYFDASKGFLRRKLTVSLKTKLNDVQRRTLFELLAAVPVPAFAAALEIDEVELATALDLGRSDMVGPLVSAFAQSASDEAFATLWARVSEAGLATVPHLDPALPRLSKAEVMSAVERLLNSGVYHRLDDLARLSGPALPAPLSAALLRSARLSGLIEEARNALIPDVKDYVRQAALTHLAAEIRVAGCLLTAPDASTLRERLTNGIYHPADPALDPLNFNIALEGIA
jgi:hypothetical protein